MNLFTIHCTQNGVDPTLKTIMDNGAASNEFLQLLQPTHNESVENNDKIEGETFKKLIHRNFRSMTLVPIKTDYEAANIKVVETISNQYLRSILDSNILALLMMVVPDWLQTDVAIKLNTQIDITECREDITELVLNNAYKFSRKRPSNPASNSGEKFPMKKDHAVPNHNSHSRNHHDAQAEKIRAETMPKLGNGSKVDLKNARSNFIVYRESKGHCLNCGKSNHKVDTCGVGPVDTRVYPNIVTQLYQQSQQNDVHKNINKLKEYVKDSYGIKLVPDTTVPIPKAVESEMKYKPQKIEFNTPTELTNIDDKNYTIHTFFIIELDIIDVLFGNDILKDSIINQKDKIIKLNNSTYKINYQQSNQLHCNIKAPRKHVTVSIDNKSESHNLLEDDEDIKEQVTKFVESIPSQICDILAKTNPEEEEIQAVRDFINVSFEDVIVDKLPGIPDQINNSRRGNIIIKKDQYVEPTKKQIYYSTDYHKRHFEEMVIKFIDLGIIKRSEFNYSSPIMLLKKRDSWRVVHDYRQLNKVTVRDDRPFTPVDSLLNQVLINPECVKYIDFITHICKFEYTRMSQRLVNSPSTFTRLMVEIFGKIKSLLQYFDDLLVYSKLDYMVHFIEIIKMLLYCRKCISPRAAKVRAISELPEPRNAKEAEAALGLFGFFRRHIENYAEKTYHLSKESKGKNKKTLSDESLKEFNILKKEFEGENIVAIPIE
ncbi:hypothetical protein ACTFIR_003970 [Dictyostelium discoideum]